MNCFEITCYSDEELSELLLNWGSKVMKSDEGFSNMLDKQMLIQLVNGNVIPKTLKQNSKTPVVKRFGGFFYLKVVMNKVMNK